MALEVEFQPAALAEAEDAAAWYGQRSVRAAEAFVAELDEAVALPREAPERWPPYVKGTRRILLRRFPFQVVYRVESSRVLIVAVAPGRRRPG